MRSIDDCGIQIVAEEPLVINLKDLRSYRFEVFPSTTITALEIGFEHRVDLARVERR